MKFGAFNFQECNVAEMVARKMARDLRLTRIYESTGKGEEREGERGRGGGEKESQRRDAETKPKPHLAQEAPRAAPTGTQPTAPPR